MIHKLVVMAALHCLKAYNNLYKDTIIWSKNLDWMGKSEEAEFEVTTMDKMEFADVKNRPNEQQDIPGEMETGTFVMSYGIIANDRLAGLPKGKDQETNNLIKELQSHASGPIQGENQEQTCTMKFPTVRKEAVEEYNPANQIFCMAFP